MFIVVTHYNWTDYERILLLFPFWIAMAVPVFMVITGYVSAMSFERKSQNLNSAYHPVEIVCKWLRFVIPFLPVFILQLLALTVVNKQVSIIEVLRLFISGGKGPGSYYFPVMIQVVILIPVIYYVIKKYNFRGLLACFIFNVLYEILKNLIGMSPVLYRLCALRYVFILSYGCFLYIIQKEDIELKQIWFYITGAIGIAYIIIFNYTGMEPIITNQWTTTSVFAVLYIVPIMFHLMKPNKIHSVILESLGKASFNIFLVQMCYYWIVAGQVYMIIPIVPLRLIVNIIVCCSLGVAFYKIESPLTQRLISKIRRYCNKP